MRGFWKRFAIFTALLLALIALGVALFARRSREGSAQGNDPAPLLAQDYSPASPSSPDKRGRRGRLPLPAVDAQDMKRLAARRLSFPVPSARIAGLFDTYSEPRNGRTHEALDIIAEHAAPVVAVEDGVIAKLFRSAAGGLTIYQFDPSSEYCYYYAHLSGYAAGLKDGMPVRRGQVIGYVGMTGNARTPHLHFAIFKLNEEKLWWRGTPVNPYPLWGSGEQRSAQRSASSSPKG